MDDEVRFKKYRESLKCERCDKDPLTCSLKSIYNPKNKFVSVCLNITNRCNMNCSYCFETVRAMNFKDMEKSNIDILFKILSEEMPDYSPGFAFIGGEPTLRLDIVEYTLQKSVECTGKHYARIYTNGSSNVDELITIARKYKNLSIQVSNNYINYVQYQDEIPIEFSVVITKDNMDKGLDKIEYLKEIGAKQIRFAFDFVREKIDDPIKYSLEIYNFLNKVSELRAPGFMILSIDDAISSSSNEQFDPDNILIDFFSDNNFYITHVIDTPSICSADKFDIDTIIGIMKNFFDESPCRRCKSNDICKLGFVQQFLKEDMSQEEYDKFCIPQVLMTRYIHFLKRFD